VGTSQKQRAGGLKGWLSRCVNLYSSSDLQHWKFEGAILRNTSITTPLPAGEPLHYRIERPKLLYNQRTQQYVLYFHLDSLRFKLGMVGVCVSSAVAGPYRFVAGYQPDGQRSLDFNLFQDVDQRAYLVRSVNNTFTAISLLSADYLHSTGIVSRAPQCEAQAIWRDGDDLFLLGSHITGWEPNEAILMHARAPLQYAVWQKLGNPSGSNTTFNSQPTAVFKVEHLRTRRRLHVYMGDRWNFNGPGSVGNASYVWLPLLEPRSDEESYRLDGLGNDGDGTWRLADFVEGGATGMGGEKPRALSRAPT